MPEKTRFQLNNSADFKGKRIAGIDYGLKRVGVAVCDEMHIVVTPKKVFDRASDTFFSDLTKFLKEENINCVVVGIPIRLDDVETELIREIKNFMIELNSLTSIPVYEQDESFSTLYATSKMIEIGKKKKKRSEKGNKDKVAAAIILSDFIYERGL